MDEYEKRGAEMLRGGDVSDTGPGVEIGGIRLAAEVGFTAPWNGFRLWIALARGELADGPCCAPERIELTFTQMVEEYIQGLSNEEADGEIREIAAWLRHYAGWLERGCNARD